MHEFLQKIHTLIIPLILGWLCGGIIALGLITYEKYQKEQELEIEFAKSKIEAEIEAKKIKDCIEKEASENKGIVNLERCI